MAFWEEVNLSLGRAFSWPARPAGGGGGPPRLAARLALGSRRACAMSSRSSSPSRSLAGPPALPHPAEELGLGRAPARAAVAGVMTWASTRSVIGLVLALSVPAALPDGRPFPERDLILAIAAVLIVGSVLLQGLTLGAVVRRAGLGERAEAEAERQAAQEAMEMARAGTDGSGFDAGRRAVLELRGRNRIGDEVARESSRTTWAAATREPAPGAVPDP